MAQSVRTNYNVQKLNNDNYGVWSFKMELLLKKEKIWDVIKLEVPTPVDSKWLENDEQALSSIGLNIEDNQISHIRGATSAKEAWDRLKDYHQKSSLLSVVLLFKQLASLRLTDGGDMEKHLADFADITDKLSALGEIVKDKLQCTFLLMSLPSSYNSTISALESISEKEFTVEIVKSRLRDEYIRRRETREPDMETAMKVTHRDNSNASKLENKPIIKCHFCKKLGHMKDVCRKFKKWKLNKEAKEAANQVTEAPVDFCHIATASITSEYCLSSAAKGVDTWYVDSGASSHMTNSKEFFDKFNITKGIVKLADNGLVKVHGIGTGILKSDQEMNNLKIADVLYVPELATNLLSVSKFVKDGFDVYFISKGYKCIICKDKKVVATGFLGSQSNLFELQIEEKAFNVTQHPDYCRHTWHRRFGHRDMNAI